MGTRSDSTAPSTGRQISAPGYALTGSLLEAGDDTQLGGGAALPTNGRSVTVWRIESGHINGIDVAGRVILTVRSRSGDNSGRGAAFLDEQASPEQALAITNAFHGRFGGPLAILAGQAGADQAFSQVPIEYWTAADERVAWMPQRVKVAARLESPPGRGPHPGTGGLRCKAEGRAAEVSVDLPEFGLTWHDSGVRARFWAFHLVFHGHREPEERSTR